MKLTAREKEIVEALQKEPLIPQDELARQFGISRSSVAVHISNLMKKGIILGKGYVFNRRVAIVVVGQVYLEIKVHGDPDSPLIDMEHTGFAYDVCRSLADYGVNPKLITIVGNDLIGNNILAELQTLDIDTAHIYRHPGKRTCKKIISESGLYLVEGYQEHDYQQLVEAREWVITNCDWLIVEERYMEFVSQKTSAQNEQNPSLCGSCYINDNVIPAVFQGTDLLVLGVDDFQNYDAYVKACCQLVEAGTSNCIITDGNYNMILINGEGTRDYPLLPNQQFNCRRELHLFLAGLVYGLSSGYPMRQAMRIASGTAHASRTAHASS